jgi:2-iminobutanoate/2-iminopropanoate deaminase
MEELKNSSRRGFGARLATIAGLAAGVRGLFGQAPAQTPPAGKKGGGRGGRGPMTHNGLIYISGIGANDGGQVGASDFESHCKKVMESIKRTVEAGGGTMDSILCLNVYLATMEDYETLNQVYNPYFPNGGPARMTVAVSGIPGRSLLEINGIAAIVNPRQG